MPIVLECPSCLTPFKVNESFAGRRGKCKNCGQKISIPGVNGSHSAASISLADATPEQMLAELARRKLTAVMAYSNLEEKPAPFDGDLLESGTKFRRVLNCLKTIDLDDETVCKLLDHWAEKANRELAARVAAEDLDDSKELFELKGDWLGMSLEEFKRKYYRELPHLGRTLPWCSDGFPGQEIPALNAERWHAAAGIVSARVDLPEENNSPTIAQERTQSVIYQFIDGKLFQIEAYFPTQSFHRILESLNRKFGAPVSESNSPREVVWWSLAATIELRFGSIRPPRPARLRFFHDALFQIAVARVPSHTHDL